MESSARKEEEGCLRGRGGTIEKRRCGGAGKRGREGRREEEENEKELLQGLNEKKRRRDVHTQFVNGEAKTGSNLLLYFLFLEI